MNHLSNTLRTLSKRVLSIFVLLWLTTVILPLTSCNPDEKQPEEALCPTENSLDTIEERSFGMGFSTWNYGPTSQSVEDTYQFVQSHGDIYSEHIDDRIPWNAWINGTALPQDFVDRIHHKASKRKPDMELLLSVSILNTGRNDLVEGWNGTPLPYDQLSDEQIEDAYIQHVTYLIEKLDPDYLVAAIEANDLLKNSPSLWADYKLLMSRVRARLKQAYPQLPISESITLHNFFEVQVDNPNAFITEITQYTNQFDFAAISFYPFFKGLKSPTDYQRAIDFLHTQITRPIAFVETNQLAENLDVPELSIHIESDPCIQKAYLETLLLNANSRHYEFVIWWAHRDYDELWETFPEEVKSLGKIWRDTGLLDESGEERPAFQVWKDVLFK